MVPHLGHLRSTSVLLLLALCLPLALCQPNLGRPHPAVANMGRPAASAGAAASRRAQRLRRVGFQRPPQLPLCTSADVLKGWWQPSQMPSAPYQPSNLAPVCASVPPPVAPWPTQSWKPLSQCRMVPWGTSHFCAVLRGRHLLIVGDSLAHAHYVALAAALGVGGGIRPGEAASVTVCQGQAGAKWGQLSFAPLSDPGGYREVLQRDGGGGPPPVDILLLSRGGAAPGSEVVQAAVTEAASWRGRCQARQEAADQPTICLLAYLGAGDTNPECESLLGGAPLPADWSSRQPTESAVEASAPGALSDADAAVVRSLESVGGQVYPLPGMERSDGCLEYCGPGPVDRLSGLLLHTMHLARQQADAA